MSGTKAPQTSTNSTEGTSDAPADTSTPKPPTQLEEDDEFEDFPVEDWDDEETDAGAGGANGTANAHLWEESWDDDDQSEDFAQMLSEELKKVDGGAKG